MGLKAFAVGVGVLGAGLKPRRLGWAVATVAVRNARRLGSLSLGGVLPWMSGYTRTGRETPVFLCRQGAGQARVAESASS